MVATTTPFFRSSRTSVPVTIVKGTFADIDLTVNGCGAGYSIGGDAVATAFESAKNTSVAASGIVALNLRKLVFPRLGLQHALQPLLPHPQLLIAVFRLSRGAGLDPVLVVHA